MLYYIIWKEIIMLQLSLYQKSFKQCIFKVPQRVECWKRRMLNLKKSVFAKVFQ